MGRAYRPKVLIETYWNVNTVAGGVDYAASVVLIETYWNVNVTWVVMGIMLLVVLIETYWNVNYVENITIKNLSKS